MDLIAVVSWLAGSKGGTRRICSTGLNEALKVAVVEVGSRLQQHQGQWHT